MTETPDHPLVINQTLLEVLLEMDEKLAQAVEMLKQAEAELALLK